MNSLFLVGGPPTVGKNECCSQIGTYIRNVEVTNFWKFVREAAKAIGTRPEIMTTSQIHRLLPTVKQNIAHLVERQTVVMLTSFTHLTVTAGLNSRPDFSDRDFTTLIEDIIPTIYIHLDARSEVIISNADAKRRGLPLGVYRHTFNFLTPRDPQERIRLVTARRLAEAIEARRLAKKHQVPLYELTVEPGKYFELQMAIVRLVGKHGGRSKKPI
ncbi:MAG: hypothetical protein WAP74_00080 [Patescibacteria group bacterium]